MQTLLLDAIGRQFGAALTMLERQIEACPDALWAAGTAPDAWHIAYHTLFYVDLYAGDGPDAFESPDIHLPDAHDLGSAPLAGGAAAPDKAAILTYSAHGRRRVAASLKRATPTWLAAEAPFPWIPLSNLEHLIYSLRHIQHHTRELSLLVKGTTGVSTGWVGTAELEPA